MAKFLKTVVEGVLYMLWGAAPIVVAEILGADIGVGEGGALAAAFALPRELVDQWPIERPLDTVFDFAEFVIGGMLGALVVL